MSVVGNLSIGMSVDLGDFLKGMKKASDQLDSFVAGMIGGLSALGASSVLAGGFTTAADAISTVVMSGAELNAVLSKSRVIFGDASSFIIDEAHKMGDQFGIVESDFINAAASFGAVFAGMGKTQEESAKLGVDLAKLGMDMKSLEGANTTAEESFQALSSALRGEFDPIEKFRVFLSADKIAAEALASGLAKSKNEISDLAKKTATLNLIYRQTTAAQGDMARTGHEADNSLAAIEGRITNFRQSLGLAFKPVTEAILSLSNTALKQLGEAINRNQEAIKAWAAEAASSSGSVFQGFKLMGTGIGFVLDQMQLLDVAWKAVKATAISAVKEMLGGINDFFQMIERGAAALTGNKAFIGNAVSKEDLDRVKKLSAAADEAKMEFAKAWAAAKPSADVATFFTKVESSVKAMSTSLTSAGTAVKNVAKELPPFSQKIADLVGNLDLQIQGFGKSSEELEIYKLKLAGASEEELKAAESKAAFLKGLKTAEATYEETRTPLEKFQSKLAELTQSYNQGAMSEEVFNRGVKKAKEDLNGASGSPFQPYGGAMDFDSKEARSSVLALRGVEGSVSDPAKDAAKIAEKQLEEQKNFNKNLADLASKLGKRANSDEIFIQ
ncbi:hypothetical protein ACYOEI_15395 [Singulisphaera rosea]